MIVFEGMHGKVGKMGLWDCDESGVVAGMYGVPFKTMRSIFIPKASQVSYQSHIHKGRSSSVQYNSIGCCVSL